MTVEELYYRLGSLIDEGYGACEVSMDVPDETAFEEDCYASYGIDHIDIDGIEVCLTAK